MPRLPPLLALAIPAALALARAEPVSPRYSGTPFLRVWRAEDYGAALSNWRVIVHPNGLVYVANNDGILEFDGESWRFTAMPRGNSARSLAIDRLGRVWAGGNDDICRLEPDANGELKAVSAIESLPPAEREVGTLSRAATTADGVFFRGQRRLVLFRPDGSSQTWPAGESVGMTWAMGGMLYAELDRMIRVERGKLVPISMGADPGSVDRVFAARPESDGWLLLTGRGPAYWRGPGSPLSSIYGASVPEPLKGDRVSAAVFLPDGRFALGTERSGLILLDGKGAVLQRIDRAQGLPGDRINDLALDDEGGLWLAMQDGIAHVDISAPFARHGAPQGFSASAVRYITEVRGQTYFAHSDGVSRRDPATGRFLPIAGFQVGSNRPLPVGDRLVVSTRGLREILPNDQSRAVWTTEVIGPILAAPGAPGWILAGAANGLLILCPDEATGGWKTLGRVGSVKTGVDFFTVDGDGFAWVLKRTGGLTRVDFRQGVSLAAPGLDFGAEQGLLPVTRRDQLGFAQLGGELFAMGAGWTRRYDRQAGRFVPDDRLPDGVTAIGRSAEGGIWLQPTARPEILMQISARPVGAWPRRELSIAPLRAASLDHLYEDVTTRSLWIGGQGALVSVDLDSAWSANPPPLRVLVRRVTTAGRELVFGGAVGFASGMRLTHRQRALRFDFAAPTFAADLQGREQTSYRTRLDGLEDSWTPWSAEAYREFTNLPSGRLTFRVQARTPDGRESREAGYAFSLLPPWWLTGWAYAGYASLGLLAVGGIVRLRTQALRRHAEQLEGIVATRTAELARLHQLEFDEKIAARLAEEKARLELLRYQLNPHFLMNAFTTLRSLVFSRPDSAGDMLGRLAEFCRFALTRTDETGGTVADEAKLIETYLETEKSRWRDQLQATVEVDPAVAGQRLPPFLLQPLVENAIKYGGRTSPDQLEVRVRVAAGNGPGALDIEVANTGGWIEPDPTRPGSTGIGMENLRQRLRRYYPEGHALRIEPAAGWVRVVLSLHRACRDPFATTRADHR